jgi:hypothetical protein
MTGNKPFTTRDITLAASLTTLKFYLVNIDYQVEGSRQQPVGYFEFDDTQALRDAEKDFQRRKLMVEPREFIENLKNLKSQVTNVFKSPNSEYAKNND